MIFPQNRHSHFCITPFSKIYLMELWLTRNILKNGNHSHRDKKQILIRSHTRRDDRFEYSKTRGWRAKNLHRSPPVTPVFTDRFQKLKWIRYFSIRKTNFPPGINFTFSSSLHPSPSVSVYLLSGRIDRIQIVWSGLSFRQPSLRSFDTGQTRIIYPIEIFKTQIILLLLLLLLLLQFCLDASTNRGRWSGRREREREREGGRFDRIFKRRIQGFIFIPG